MTKPLADPELAKALQFLAEYHKMLREEVRQLEERVARLERMLEGG